MKTKKRINQKFSLVPMGIIVAMIFTGILSCTGQKTDNTVNEAYKLRITGHADSAKVLLEQFTTDNPENALAWYELSRTNKQLGKANPRAIKESLDEAMRCINLAVENDPENALYLSYKGSMETLQFYLGLQMGNENAADYVSYWKEIVEDMPGNADAQQALGRVYLFAENIDEATVCYQKAIEIDPSKNVLYLDLGRYYMMMAMQNPALIDSAAPLLEKEFNKYLNFNPEAVAPMQAWANGLLSMINRRTGNTEAADKFLAKAKALDPFFSQASGKPNMSNFCPPGVAMHEQSYYLSPF